MSPQENIPARYSWSEVWTAVITRPSVQTFTEVLNDPAATPRRAYVWLYLTGCVAAFVMFYTLMSALTTDPEMQQLLPETMSLGELQSSLWLTMLCVVPFAGAISIVFFMVFARAVHYIAERLDSSKKKPGRYGALVYTLSAIAAPLNILSVLILILSVSLTVPAFAVLLSLVSLALSVYQLILMVQGIRAVYGLTPGQSTVALGVPLFGIVVLYLLLL
ncbi:MAG: YIP1 family protein [Anaerolineae bacterium]|nr:YIP1 family protein [Anaerolineae bacterium]